MMDQLYNTSKCVYLFACPYFYKFVANVPYIVAYVILVVTMIGTMILVKTTLLATYGCNGSGNHRYCTDDNGNRHNNDKGNTKKNLRCMNYGYWKKPIDDGGCKPW